ncbi:MAG TPA: ROK family protein [Propionibacterium sp.]|nr:ROK family protein [Propionibacterium sp.]
MKHRYALGIDIGGSGIKGAIVDLKKGEFALDRLRIPTPRPATPEAVAAVVKQIADHFAKELGDGPIGITVPAVVTHGYTRSAANIDPTWVDAPAEEIFRTALGRPITLVNDADAAGIAEVLWGAAKDHPGLVIVTTLGTGIGTAMIHKGTLIPNIELGHIEMFGKDAEPQAAASVKDREELSYETWATERLQPYYERLEFYTWPDLIVVGGGVSKESDQFLPLLNLKTPIVPAKLRNQAGIIGAAWLAVDELANPDALKEGASGSAKGGKKKSGKGKKG